MNRHPNRLTVIVTGSLPFERAWRSPAETTDLFFLDSVDAALEMARGDGGLDVARVILERGSADDADFLDFLAKTGCDFSGDVMLIRLEGNGFLSSISRGGARVLYSLKAADVDFYLAIHALTVTDIDASASDLAVSLARM